MKSVSKGDKHIQLLVLQALERRTKDEQTVGQKLGVPENDPVRLAPTIAPTQPPSTHELIINQRAGAGN